MKKLNLLALSAVLCISGMYAAPRMVTSNIWVINKTERDLAIGPRTKIYSSKTAASPSSATSTSDGEHRAQVGASMVVKPGQSLIVADLERDQADLFSPNRAVQVDFAVNGEVHSFVSSMLTHVSTQLDYYNAHQNIRRAKLPVKVQGLEIKSEYVFPNLYHDIKMEFYPGYSK